MVHGLVPQDDNVVLSFSSRCLGVFWMMRLPVGRPEGHGEACDG